MFINNNMIVTKHNKPFQHWELSNILTEECLNEINYLSTEVVPSSAKAKRSEHSNRTFVTDGKLAKYVDSALTRQAISDITNIDLNGTRARLELCIDLPGFCLEPHLDVPEKLITMQVYISGEKHCGTNLYPKLIEFKKNNGWLIVNNKDTTHGFDYREFTKPRVSLVLNYVTNEWWDVDQLVNVS